jgi:hypothetical protein
MKAPNNIVLPGKVNIFHIVRSAAHLAGQSDNTVLLLQIVTPKGQKIKNPFFLRIGFDLYEFFLRDHPSPPSFG